MFSGTFEAANGWTTNPNGADTAMTGAWERGDPEATTSGGTTVQLGTTTSGGNDLVTGRLAGASVGANDIDGGTTRIQSPQITLPSTGTLSRSFSWHRAHLGNASSADFLRVRVVTGSGASTVFEKLGAAATVGGAWQGATANLTSFAGQTIRVLVEAADTDPGSLIEAGIDDVRITMQ